MAKTRSSGENYSREETGTIWRLLLGLALAPLIGGGCASPPAADASARPTSASSRDSSPTHLLLERSIAVIGGRQLLVRCVSDGKQAQATGLRFYEKAVADASSEAPGSEQQVWEDLGPGLVDSLSWGVESSLCTINVVRRSEGPEKGLVWEDAYELWWKPGLFAVGFRATRALVKAETQ